ncbi:Uncharacterised protein [Tsukamurella paurometabola]|uniref:TetR family transcriptional regulator n=2 Tax=Tsukamurella paurometabola TaxID=2061 RepID=A0A3P8L545_TSUPA|nr:Uncharacterised protein [Tsukamurella paurometabola]
MLDAGIEMLGAPEPGVLGVRAVCRSTGITERYFYEAFGTREGFVHAVYDDVARRAQEAILGAMVPGPETSNEAIRVVVTAFFEFVVDNPAVGRTLLLGPDREPALAERGLQHSSAFVELMTAARPEGIDENLSRMGSTALVGAQAAAYMAYLSGGFDVPREELIDYCVFLIEASTDYFVGRVRSGS